MGRGGGRTSSRSVVFHDMMCGCAESHDSQKDSCFTVVAALKTARRRKRDCDSLKGALNRVTESGREYESFRGSILSRGKAGP